MCYGNTGIWLADTRKTVTFIFAMRLVSIAAKLPMAAEMNKRKQMQSLKTKTFNFLTQLFKPLPSPTSSPDLLLQWFQIVCRSTDMCTKADKTMYSKTVWKPGDFLKAHSLLRKIQRMCLTMNYDDNTYYFLRIIRCKIIERRQNMCTLAVAACVDVIGYRLALVESFHSAVMHVVKTIFIISVSTSWMFTYHDKWNRHGKIVISWAPSFHASPPCLFHGCLCTEFVIIPPVRI